MYLATGTPLFNIRGNMYWWIKTTHEGRLVILGPYATEGEASDFAFQQLGTDFEVFDLPTRDKARATSMIKARILKQTSSLDTALQRARHKLPDGGVQK